MNRRPFLEFSWRMILFLAAGYVFARAFLELEQIGWGSGTWLWRLSLKWAVVLVVFILLMLLNLVVIGLALWKPLKLSGLSTLISVRERLAWTRWLIAGVILALPLWFLVGTYWGLMLTGPSMRFLILFWMAIGIGFILTRGEKVIGWQPIMVALILTGAGAAIVRELANVTDYPFSLYWSEGNRFWDYSIMFGRDRYIYPADQPIYAYIEKPRQFLWGLPFLLPGLNIAGMRLWNAIIYIVPYILLGWAAFRYTSRGWKVVLCGLWAYIFLSQGPIYTQLIFVALMVALAWYRRWWIALPFFLLASYLAYISRITWTVAPILWVLIMLAGNASISWAKLWGRKMIRMVLLMVALGVAILGMMNFSPLYNRLVDILTHQPLLWYRLLPNPTYPAGILLGSILATGPVIYISIYLLATKRWPLGKVRTAIIYVMLTVAFGVGIVVSAKIGGGADLHNMDIFLISALFLAVLAWKNGGDQIVSGLDLQPAAVKLTFLLLVLIPAFQQMRAIQPLVQESDQLVRSTLVSLGKDDSRLLPSSAETGQVLAEIQQQVARTQQTGEVLFMDQRQLLTFGDIPKLPLVVEYEKKLLIDLALSGGQSYFATFYRDVSSQRFSLIVSEPLRTRKEQSQQVTGSFGEEDDIWVTWVAEPVLCYYEPIFTDEAVGVQLLIPRQVPLGCSHYP
jgi:hypothetical protein